MSALTEFLLARIAEEGNAARIAAGVPEAAMNITRWHSAHVLADCEAKRRIVELHNQEYDNLEQRWHEEYEGSTKAMAEVLRLLALPYADHPDYDEAWRPAS